MESTTQSRPAAPATFASEEKQYTPVNLKPYFIYGRFPIIPFMATLGIGAYIASLIFEAFFK